MTFLLYSGYKFTFAGRIHYLDDSRGYVLERDAVEKQGVATGDCPEYSVARRTDQRCPIW
ncbi:hypothetical protein KL86PLE_70178 [uncultured Pleomorphomonas sp.]|uniref:Uncharacterized protein n=1 Tax=uncultured Pleomorphomonas sp. TaxID=442121 RepID=A0A212LLN1_9HYPH|nr:hypothetical protein KL86PLE_70178 [uncultured Pleomorphomonas sp.]